MSYRARKREWVLGVGSLVVAVVTSAGLADTPIKIADFQFTSGSAVSSDADSASTASGAAFGNFTQQTTSPPTFTSNQARVTGLTTGTDVNVADTLAAALSTDAYLGFTLSASGKNVSLTTLSFDHGFLALNSLGQNAHVSVLLNKTGSFSASDLLTDFSYTNTTGTATDFGPLTRTVDLSGNAAFQNFTSTLFVRLYFYDNVNQAGRAATIDNLSLVGVAPKPASAGLIGVMAAGTLLRRRKSQRVIGTVV